MTITVAALKRALEETDARFHRDANEAYAVRELLASSSALTILAERLSVRQSGDEIVNPMDDPDFDHRE